MCQSSEHSVVTDFQRLCCPMLERIEHMNKGKSAELVATYLEKLSAECLKKTLMLLKETKLMRSFFGTEKAYIKVRVEDN